MPILAPPWRRQCIYRATQYRSWPQMELASWHGFKAHVRCDGTAGVKTCTVHADGWIASDVNMPRDV